MQRREGTAGACKPSGQPATGFSSFSTSNLTFTVLWPSAALTAAFAGAIRRTSAATTQAMQAAKMSRPNAGRTLSVLPMYHMAAACAVLFVLWIWYPRLKVLWAIGGICGGRRSRQAQLSFPERRHRRRLPRRFSRLVGEVDLESEWALQGWKIGSRGGY
jgi:hypothetical protein